MSGVSIQLPSWLRVEEYPQPDSGIGGKVQLDVYGNGWNVTRIFYFTEDTQETKESFLQKLVSDSSYLEQCLTGCADWQEVAHAYEQGAFEIEKLFASQRSAARVLRDRVTEQQTEELCYQHCQKLYESLVRARSAQLRMDTLVLQAISSAHETARSLRPQRPANDNHVEGASRQIIRLYQVIRDQDYDPANPQATANNAYSLGCKQCRYYLEHRRATIHGGKQRRSERLGEYCIFPNDVEHMSAEDPQLPTQARCAIEPLAEVIRQIDPFMPPICESFSPSSMIEHEFASGQLIDLSVEERELPPFEELLSAARIAQAKQADRNQQIATAVREEIRRRPIRFGDHGGAVRTRPHLPIVAEALHEVQRRFPEAPYELLVENVEGLTHGERQHLIELLKRSPKIRTELSQTVTEKTPLRSLTLNDVRQCLHDLAITLSKTDPLKLQLGSWQRVSSELQRVAAVHFPQSKAPTFGEFVQELREALLEPALKSNSAT